MLKPVLALSLLAAAGSANAAVLFSDNFDALTPALTVTNLPNWNVVGNVDVVAGGTFGITCSGNCVDLDGTTGPGALTSTGIAYSAGELLTISFDLSGSQRTTAVDTFRFTADFAAPTDITEFGCLTGFDPSQCGSGTFLGLTSLGLYSEDVAGTRPFLTYALAFRPTTAGTLTLQFSTTSGDNVGPVLDNVSVSGVIPEPATWAMMILGFGLVGFAARRRAALAA